MKINARSAARTTAAAKRAPARPTKDSTAAKATKGTAWKAGGKADPSKAIRDMLTHPQGRVSMGGLLENELGDANTGTGYSWDPADAKPMQWTMRNVMMGDDSLLVQVAGKKLTITSEMSGFSGEASISAATPQALQKAIAHANAALGQAADAARGG